MTKLIHLIKSNFSLVLLGIMVVLFATGNLGGVATVAQTAMLKTGIMNARIGMDEVEDFDFNFSVKDLKGNPVGLDQYKGKVLFINLWATWCGPCRAEMPTIQELYNEVDHDKIAFVMLSLDKAEDQAKVVSYVKKKNYTFPVFTLASPLPAILNVPSIPTTFVISKQGKIISQNVGTTNFNTKKFKKFLLDESAK